jgi:hypothetical protein
VYGPADFVVGVDDEGNRTFTPAVPGTQSEPGLVVFRYDAELVGADDRLLATLASWSRHSARTGPRQRRRRREVGRTGGGRR